MKKFNVPESMLKIHIDMLIDVYERQEEQMGDLNKDTNKEDDFIFLKAVVKKLIIAMALDNVDVTSFHSKAIFDYEMTKGFFKEKYNFKVNKNDELKDIPFKFCKFVGIPYLDKTLFNFPRI